MHLDQFQRIVVSPASVTVLELSQHGSAMLKCNDTGSLDELVPKPEERASDLPQPEQPQPEHPQPEQPQPEVQSA
jgi:hypothetical protein